MGACKTGGSVIDFVMKREGLGFNEAVEELQKLAQRLEMQGPVKVFTPKRLEKSPGRKIPTTQSLNAKDRDFIFSVIEYYQTNLRQNSGALTYLQTRGLGSEESLRKHKIGYSDGNLNQALPSRQSLEGQRTRGILKDFGIFGENGHEHFKARLVFPIFTQEGDLCGMYGRRIIPSKNGAPDHLYLPGKHLGIWNEADGFEKNDLVLCESILDALTYWENGVRNVTCSYGTEGYTEELHQRIVEKGIKRVYIAYDGDAAGDNGTKSVNLRLKQERVTVYRLNLPESRKN